ncbi:hypothetical protein [Pseudoalteromonas phage vB_PtuP_Slicky01]|nr:hypothetical protein [Pseudoalteromonas phage vB_PtuP_Slicky01]
MSKWCIVSNKTLKNPLNPTALLLSEGLCDIGVSHDNINRVFTSVPSDYLEEDVVIVNRTEETTDMELIGAIGGFLKSESPKVLIADRSIFSMLFNHPIHKLWCGNYESKQELQADYKLVFGVDDLDGRKSLDTLKLEAHEAVFNTLP